MWAVRAAAVLMLTRLLVLGLYCKFKVKLIVSCKAGQSHTVASVWGCVEAAGLTWVSTTSPTVSLYLLIRSQHVEPIAARCRLLGQVRTSGRERHNLHDRPQALQSWETKPSESRQTFRDRERESNDIKPEIIHGVQSLTRPELLQRRRYVTAPSLFGFLLVAMWKKAIKAEIRPAAPRVPNMGSDLQSKGVRCWCAGWRIWSEASKSLGDKVTDKSGRLSNTFAIFNEFILLLCAKWF